MSPHPMLALASASPRRQDLLRAWKIDFVSLTPEVDETFDEALDPAQDARRLAILKAEWVRDHHAPAAPILAADTIVAQGSRKLGKPEDEEDAVEILMSLSGQLIQVVTGVALSERGRATLSGHTTTRLRMRSFNRLEAETYAATGEPMGKAGAFAIQGEGKELIADRQGSLSNVIGLPRELVLQLLQSRQDASGTL